MSQSQLHSLQNIYVLQLNLCAYISQYLHMRYKSTHDNVFLILSVLLTVDLRLTAY
jgi:hypothetical protein